MSSWGPTHAGKVDGTGGDYEGVVEARLTADQADASADALGADGAAEEWREAAAAARHTTAWFNGANGPAQ